MATQIPSELIANNAVGITQLNVSDGSNGQVLTTNGSGTLSFSTVSGTTINNNADNRVITGSGTANTLEGEANVIIDSESNIAFGTQKVDPNWSQFFNALSGNYGGHLSFQNNNVPVTTLGNNFYINNSTLYERVLAYPTQMMTLDHQGNFLFYTAASGTAGATFSFTEAMRIAVNGGVHIGTSSEANGSTGGCSFSPDSSDRRNFICATTGTGTVELIEFRNPNGTVGDIKVSGSATSYATSSDGRLKNVTGVARGLDVINKLNPVAFNWKVDNKASEGLIAQEVKDLVPDAVSQNTQTEYYQMDYSKLVVHLIAGMKEQQEQIDALQSEINLLKGK